MMSGRSSIPSLGVEERGRVWALRSMVEAGRGIPSLLGVGVGVSGGDGVGSVSPLVNSIDSLSSTGRMLGGKWSGPFLLALDVGRTPIGLGRAAAVMDLMLEISFIFLRGPSVFSWVFILWVLEVGCDRVGVLVTFGRER